MSLYRRLVLAVPPVGRPWNPGLHQTWDAMTDFDRREARLWDWIVAGAGAALIYALAKLVAH